MDQEKVRFKDSSTEEVHRACVEDGAGEAKPLLCSPTNENTEFAEKETPAIRDKAVVNDEHVNDAVKADEVSDSSFLKHTGDLLEKSDGPNEKTQIFDLENDEEKVDVSDERIDSYVPDNVIIKNSGQGEICSNSFKSIECVDENSGINPQKCFEKTEERKQNLGPEIIIIDDNLDSDESETNVSRTSNDDVDQSKCSMLDTSGQNISDEKSLEQEVTIRNASDESQKVNEEGSTFVASNASSFAADSVSKCTQDDNDFPKTEIRECTKDIVKMLDSSAIYRKDHLWEYINKKEHKVKDCKTNVDSYKTLAYANENNLINENNVENLIHQFDEAQNDISVERIQPLKNTFEQRSSLQKVVEDEKKTFSVDERIKRISQATPHSPEHGDNAISNKTEEEEIICVQKVEVMEPKEKEETNQKHSEAEKAGEEGIKDSQRPRSRTYPFKVLVSGLPLGARREDVMCYFSQFGEVLKLWDEGRHRANVLFADEESYKKAVCAPEPYFDDHKLLIRSLNETVAVISGIPRAVPAKDVEKAIRDILEEAGAHPCRIIVPLSDPAETSENNILQGHALVAFNDPQTLQKAEERENKEPFLIANKPIKLHLSCNEFYEKFCIRVYPLPSEQPRVLLYHNIHATFKQVGEIVAIMCQYVGNSSTYAGYVLFESEDSVKKAKEMEEIKILSEFVQVQDFHPFEQGQGFRHLWLKIHNLPPRATITEIKHHFGHDRGILNIELDLDFGSCFMHVNSESAMQRCLRMHQTYLRGKCIAVMITEDHPDRAYYREISRRGRRPNFRNNTGRKKAVNSSSSNFNGKTFTSAAQPQGNQDRRGFERGDRKFSKSRSNNNHAKELPKVVKEDGDGVKIADTPAV